MTLQPNGTHAKEVAVHFIEKTTERATPAVYAKVTKMAKTILASGYSKDEIVKVIDYIVDVKGVQMYSLGYVNTCINEMLKEIEQEELKKQGQEIKKTQLEQPRSEVIDDGESRERNRDKAKRFGILSGFREKHHLDMFERPGQDRGSRE
jgi:hypothetical protein